MGCKFAILFLNYSVMQLGQRVLKCYYYSMISLVPQDHPPMTRHLKWFVAVIGHIYLHTTLLLTPEIVGLSFLNHVYIHSVILFA